MSRSEYRAEDAITIAISPEQWNSSDPPTIKRPRGSPEELPTSISSRSRTSGKIFFKTKLCGRFRAGNCNFSNCNFAHGMEELRRPPNWQDGAVDLREEHTIPVLSSSAMAADGERSYKGRKCKKFYTGEGCPYGDSCTFLHDEQSKERESVAITVGSGGGGAQKPSNWKTRICNKWEVTGYCPFGSKCHFAHGSSELHKYGGGLVEAERREPSSMVSLAAIATEAKALAEPPAAGPSTAAVEIYHRRFSGGGHRGQRPLERWRGPEKISKIYGDWIDDNE